MVDSYIRFLGTDHELVSADHVVVGLGSSFSELGDSGAWVFNKGSEQLRVTKRVTSPSWRNIFKHFEGSTSTSMTLTTLKSTGTFNIILAKPMSFQSPTMRAQAQMMVGQDKTLLMMRTAMHSSVAKGEMAEVPFLHVILWTEIALICNASIRDDSHLTSMHDYFTYQSRYLYKVLESRINRTLGVRNYDKQQSSFITLLLPRGPWTIL